MTTRDRNSDLAPAVPRGLDLERRLTEWLSVGGFWNPEMMGQPRANADALRDLILETRDYLRALASLSASQEPEK